MGDLTVFNQNGRLWVDSREVAAMVGKEHFHLLRDIRGYAEILNQSNFECVDFFQENTYQDAKGETRCCYRVTKKGCDMIANKLTGAKGVLFTAAYVTRFNEMEKRPMSQVEVLAGVALAMVEQERQLKALVYKQRKQAEEIQGIREVVALSSVEWRKDCTALVKKMSQKLAGNFGCMRDLFNESYKMLNERMGVDLNIRLTNKRRRMADEGICKSRRDSLTVLDVIADDKKLIEGYIAIVKEMAIRYGVGVAA